MFVGYINRIDAVYMIIGNINKDILRHSHLMQRLYVQKLSFLDTINNQYNTS